MHPGEQLARHSARNWLRHNDKVRDAVLRHLPELIAGPDLITGLQERTVQVPVRLLEHARFRLAEPRSRTGAGQGAGKPGDVLQWAARHDLADGDGGNEDGGVRLLLELSIDEVMDWVWEELRLPDLKLKARARKPGISAVILFVLDVSASMTELERKLAKSFFFFALQGIRRQYARVETRFVAHTTHAWQFSEAEFFQVSGMGGTIASSAFRLALDIVRKEFDPAQDNVYMFYASDGENFTEDRTAAGEALTELGTMLNHIGYVETLPGVTRSLETEMRRLCGELERRGVPIGSSVLTGPDDVWRALRKFFTQKADDSAEAPA
ncbi:DUF444 family protein [Massilia cavernae]|uniref:DUF444 family protein n=1 Tax=Massilia cavernae TaxID=2320864 RepID=A0A418Y896_9BURK|nr:DUF444 family protein [Massilia cavernae]RJG27616.1 DUF444 family protein [Massilia cavernae]